jgi:hypothetical protein
MPGAARGLKTSEAKPCGEKAMKRKADSKSMYRVTIASGKGQTLAVVFTPHPEIARITRELWRDHVLGWRKTGAYRVKVKTVDPMLLLAS